MFIVAEEEDDFSPFFILLFFCFFVCVLFFNLTGFSEGISVGNQKEELRIRTQNFKI